MAERPGRSAAAWVAEAVTTGRLQKLKPSMPAAGEMINRARAHLRSATTIAANDPTLALSASHDAARQAISAHLRAGGYRVANEAGAHRTVIEYAGAVLAALISGDDMVALDDLRRDRHTAEYGDFASRVITPDRARDAVALASRVVDVVAGALAKKS